MSEQVRVKRAVTRGNSEKEEKNDVVIRGFTVMSVSSVLGLMKVKRGRKLYRYGRLYIPVEYLEKVGISEEDLQKGVEVNLEIITSNGKPLIVIKPKVVTHA